MSLSSKPGAAEYLSYFQNDFPPALAAIAPLNASHSVKPVKMSYSSSYTEAGLGKTLSWTLGGLAWLPLSTGGPTSVPILAFQHGTQVNRPRAPSLFNPNPAAALGISAISDPEGALLTYLECMICGMMATKGYLVVMTDYPGFGADAGPHPYVHRALGSAVRDIVAKAAELAGGAWSDKVSWNGQIYLLGYSEGGYATMVGARAIQDNPIAGGSVVAAVPCDGSYDFSGAMIPRILKPVAEPAPYYVPYVIFGYNYVYGSSSGSTLDFSRILKNDVAAGKNYASILPPLFDGNHSSAAIIAAMPSAYPKEVLSDAAIADLQNPSSDLFLKLQANDSYRGWTPAMKLQMIQCATDDVIQPENAENAFAAFNDLAHVPAVIYVNPISIAANGQNVSDQVHVRAFPTALLRGFKYIAGGS